MGGVGWLQLYIMTLGFLACSSTCTVTIMNVTYCSIHAIGHGMHHCYALADVAPALQLHTLPHLLSSVAQLHMQLQPPWKLYALQTLQSATNS